MGQCVSTQQQAQQNSESSSCRRGKFSWNNVCKHKNKARLRGTSCNSQLDVYQLQSPHHKKRNNKGQHHLLYKRKESHSKKQAPTETTTPTRAIPQAVETLPTRLLERTDVEDGSNHIYAIRCHSDLWQQEQQQPQEQRPTKTLAVVTSEPSTTTPVTTTKTPRVTRTSEPSTPVTSTKDDKDSVAVNTTTSTNTTTTTTTTRITTTTASVSNKNDLYSPANMAAKTSKPITEWTCVSQQHAVYVCDTGLTPHECDEIVLETEQACRGHYAAYTYAKQTLGCRDYPKLAQTCWNVVHRVCSSIDTQFPTNKTLVLDDREPHMVKYDVSKRERQKLDMHTDKSEWTFLIALSDGCGLDYNGGGTYFEALDATVHIQRGHALIFPGKLRHCGRKISKGLRFLLVGFLVDKTASQAQVIVNENSSKKTSDNDKNDKKNDNNDKKKDNNTTVTTVTIQEPTTTTTSNET